MRGVSTRTPGVLHAGALRERGLPGRRARCSGAGVEARWSTMAGEIAVDGLRDDAVSLPVRMRVGDREQITVDDFRLERGKQIDDLDIVRAQEADDPGPRRLFLVN